ncbi:substrate-binding periplasmic protein [Aeromonas veronii]|uniref:substrate-binding periplasmic protein n=1 Tax=Aeromonas veronii TaxID=654 RepID=UPI002B4A77DA|nr:transporter substrate-binding domain-containing protein [Aeromonas veronii]
MKHCLWLLCCWCVWLQAAPLLLVTGEFTPYTGKALPEGGESTRLVTTLLQEAGYREIQVDYLPWPRGYQLTRNGLVAATFPYAWTAERAKLFHYSAPIHIDRLSWFTYWGNEAIQAGRWQGLRVCIPLGWSTSHADGVIKRFGLDLQRPKTLAQCLQLLDRKRIDLLPMNETVTRDASRQLFGDPCHLQALPHFRQSDTFYLVISRQYPEAANLLERFNHALAAARADGRYDKLVSRAGKGIDCR